MRSGRMRHRATLLALTVAQDPASNQDVPTWTAVGSIYGLMQPLHGVSAFNAKQLKEGISELFTTRWQGSLAVDPTMRLIFNGNTYEISSSLNIDERNRELHLYLTRIVDPDDVTD